LTLLLTVNYPSFDLDKNRKPLICLVLNNFSRKYGFSIKDDPNQEGMPPSGVTFDEMVKRIQE